MSRVRFSPPAPIKSISYRAISTAVPACCPVIVPSRDWLNALSRAWSERVEARSDLGVPLVIESRAIDLLAKVLARRAWMLGVYERRLPEGFSHRRRSGTERWSVAVPREARSLNRMSRRIGFLFARAVQLPLDGVERAIMAQLPERLISWPELRPLIGSVSRTTWWRAVRRGDAPPPVAVSPGRKAWTESSILAWQAGRSRPKEA